MPRFRIVVDTGFSGCEYHDEVEYDDGDWAKMTVEEREKELLEASKDAIHNFINAWWEEIPTEEKER